MFVFIVFLALLVLGPLDSVIRSVAVEASSSCSSFLTDICTVGIFFVSAVA